MERSFPLKTSRLDLKKLLAETVNAVRDRVDLTPHVGVVLGGDLGSFAERLRNAVEVPFAEMPHMPMPSVGRGGSLYLGFLDDVPVACLCGRLHLGEGVPAWQLVHGVRTMARLGARAVLVAETAGVIEPSFHVGDLMVVVDHVNLTFHGGLGDVGGEGFDSFPNMRSAYDPELRAELHEVARMESMLSARIGKTSRIDLVEGVYAGLQDPTYETPAQVRMLRALGADALGLSTMIEVTALRQMGVRVAALAYLGYRAIDSDKVTLEDEATSRSSLGPFQRLVRGWMVRAHRA